MGANVWFWLIYVLVAVLGALGLGPWRGQITPWGYFGGYIVCIILIGILGYHDFGPPIR